MDVSLRDALVAEASAVAHCRHCRTGYQVLVHLRPLRSDAKAGCGTEAGYQLHIRPRERPCEGCADAHMIAVNPEGRHPRGRTWEEGHVQRRARVAAVLAEIDDEGGADA
jgi:hypothetical protein